MKTNTKTVYGKSNVGITKKHFVKVGLLFMMIMSFNFTFGQQNAPNKDFSPKSEKAVAIVSNSDARGGDGNEYIYLRSGEEDNEEWYYDAQFIVADDWVGVRRPLRFYTERNSWSGSGEYIMNTLNLDQSDGYRGYGLSFFAGSKESMTITKDGGISTYATAHSDWADLKLIADNDNSSTAEDIIFGFDGNASDFTEKMRLTDEGNLYIGVKSDSISSSLKEKYDLFVNNGVLAEDLAISGTEYWSDYVFAKNYKLRPLSEVAQFIKENKHLPNIPSKEVISKEGYSMHNMNVLFLEKIEELTLYIIQQEKQIKKLSDKLDSLTDTDSTN